MKQILNKICNDTRGFTLLEVLVAGAILSVGLLGLAALTGTTIKGNACSTRMTTATNLAHDRMDSLLALTYNTGDQVDADTSNNPANGGNLYSTAVTDYSQNIDVQWNNVTNRWEVTQGTRFTRIWNIADNEPSANMKTVVVMVSWNEDVGGADTTRTVTLSTLITM